MRGDEIVWSKAVEMMWPAILEATKSGTDEGKQTDPKLARMSSGWLITGGTGFDSQVVH